MAAPIPRQIVPSVEPAPQSPEEVGREFRELSQGGARIRPAGQARSDPPSLLRRGYRPRYKLELFGTTFYLADVRQNEDIRFFVAYLVPPGAGPRAPQIFPRILYKDISLVWRSASHYVRTQHELWIGKGDVRVIHDAQGPLEVSNEATTDLPVELQPALEELIRRPAKIRTDRKAVELVLRRAPPQRFEPYRDFVEPRRRAMAQRRNRVNGGRPIARFRKANDPASLVFASGYEPDFGRGVLKTQRSRSSLYGGLLRRVRIVSRNRRVQYLFIAGRRQAWIGTCQATTTELSSYGVRTVDAVVDDDLLCPGYEYHFEDDGELFSQIPEGFAGAPSPGDDFRADASPWLDRLPVIRDFKRRVLGRRVQEPPPLLDGSA